MNEPTRKALEILQHFPRCGRGSAQNYFRMSLFCSLAASFGRGRWASVNMSIEEAIDSAIRLARECGPDADFVPTVV
jgi:hypothetical protein